MPNSLLARTFLLLATLVILTTIAWLGLFVHVDAEPRARESARLAASTVNLIRAAIFAAAPENRPALFAELGKREGIRLLPAEADEQLRPLPQHRFFQLLEEELRLRLGPATRVAEAVDGNEGFWISFHLVEGDDDEYWLILPAERLAHNVLGQWLLWALLAFGLALAMAALIATRLSQPLKSMARSARLVGQGERPEPLAEVGPRELRELATAFNRMAEDLRQLEEDRAEVLAGISHDLRTPLTRLRLEAEMSIPDPAARESACADIEQMDAVLSQFMDYARGQQGESPVATDLNTLLMNLADGELARGRQLTVESQLNSPVEVRPRALYRAVANLVDNAWKYGATEVHLSARESAGIIEIDVCDDGPGIPDEAIERLKRPFTRLESARSNASGTGLGLAIVERIVRWHGGSLTLSNRAQGGLQATIRLFRP